MQVASEMQVLSFSNDARYDWHRQVHGSPLTRQLDSANTQMNWHSTKKERSKAQQPLRCDRYGNRRGVRIAADGG